MQSETDIDVWGRPYSNQVEPVRHLLAALPEDRIIIVNANQKSSYEASHSSEYTINEPTYDPTCLSLDNMGKVTSTLMQVLDQLPQKADL